jgi:hypothetical protein
LLELSLGQTGGKRGVPRIRDGAFVVGRDQSPHARPSVIEGLTFHPDRPHFVTQPEAGGGGFIQRRRQSSCRFPTLGLVGEQTRRGTGTGIVRIHNGVTHADRSY